MYLTELENGTISIFRLFRTELQTQDFYALQTFWKKSSDSQMENIFLEALTFFTEHYTSLSVLIGCLKK